MVAGAMVMCTFVVCALPQYFDRNTGTMFGAISAHWRVSYGSASGLESLGL